MSCVRSVVLASFIGILFLVSGCREDTPPQGVVDTTEHYTLEILFSEVIERIRTDYCTAITETHLIKGAITGILMALDPYSGYMEPREAAVLDTINKGEFGGVGLEILPIKQGLKVISAIDDTPAHRANIQSGDLITHVDGVDVAKAFVADALKQLQGKPGTPVTLTLLNEKNEKRNVVLTRSMIIINAVKSEVHDKIAYLRIGLFNEHCERNVKNALDSFLQEGNLHGLIIDLRNNPGGTLDQAVATTGLFLDGGTVVSVHGRSKEDQEVYAAKGPDRVRGLPIVILVNKGSASGAEILAAALKDHKRAIIIGEKTFGKGSVQTLFHLSNKGALKLTTAYFYSPKLNRIQEKGVEPDIIVEAESTDRLFDRKKDTQLKRAYDLLRGLSFFQMSNIPS